jgi:hypothetical protein
MAIHGRMNLALALALLAAGPALAGEATFTVKYRSAASVYLDGGKAQALAVGDRLLVVSAGATIAELEVVFLAEHSASCRVVSEKRAVRGGDVAVPVKKAASAAPAPTSETATKTAAAPRPVSGPAAPFKSTAKPRPFARARGGVSLGYYRVWDQSSPPANFEQRTGRADLTLWDIGGRPYTLNTHFRSRQDIRSRLSTLPLRDQRSDRLYELSLRYDPPTDRLGFEVGRIGTSQFTGIGYLDGGMVRLQVAAPLQIGGFFGRRADIDSLTFEGSGQKYGGYLRWAPGGRYSTRSGDAQLAVIREFAGAEISREYLSLESHLGSGVRWSLFQRTEVDLNRDWRRDVSDRAYQLSTLSVSTNFRFSASTSLAISYDSRKNYRDHLNRLVPEVIFDDLLHQGLRGSLYFGRPYGISISGSVGVRFKEKASNSDAYSFNGGVRHDNLFSTGFSIGADGSGFSNGFTDGYLVNGRLGRRFSDGRTQVDFSYGKSLYRLKATNEKRNTEWFRFSLRGDIYSGLYLLTDLEHDRGDDLKGPRGLFELGYQF